MCRGKEVTGRDKDAPLARSTWLGGWGDNSGTYSQPPCLPPRPPGGRWSTGVIMYTLLAGSPPFWHRKQMLMLRMIMSGHYQFGSPEWDDYSDTVKDLVRGLRRAAGLEAPAGKGPRLDATRSPSHSQVSRFLVVNPQSRCSAEEALAHPFFQQYVVEEVRHFSPRGKFKVLQLASQPGPRGGCCRLPNPSPQCPWELPTASGLPEHRPRPPPTPSQLAKTIPVLAGGVRMGLPALEGGETGSQARTRAGDRSDGAGFCEDLLPVPPGEACDPGDRHPRPLRPPASAATHRCLRIPNLWPLGEEGAAAEPGSPLREHTQGRAPLAG